MATRKHLTPSQHYIEAERLIREAREALSVDHSQTLLMEAQVHATLANFATKDDAMFVSRDGRMDIAGRADCTQPLHRMSHEELMHFGINREEWS